MNVFRMKCFSFIFISIFTLTFFIFSKSAYATDIVFTGLQAEMSSTFDGEGNETLSLLVDSTQFSTGSFAGGEAIIAGGDIPIVSDVVWYMEGYTGVDGSPAISFSVGEGGIIDPDVMPVWRVLVGIIDPEIIINPDIIPIGELDFSAVTGTKGYLNLTGLEVLVVDADGVLTGDVYDVPDFTITDSSTPEVAEVNIDIKPGSDPNCFNVNGHGVIPVAILGSSEFDVYDIDLATPTFGGLEVRVRGNRGPLCSTEYVNGDEFIDMVCHFEDNTDNWTPGNAVATLTGQLQDGTAFEGSDSICIVQ